MDNITAKRLAELMTKIARLKTYREDLNDTNEDTLSIDQILDRLEEEVRMINYSAGVKK